MNWSDWLLLILIAMTLLVHGRRKRWKRSLGIVRPKALNLSFKEVMSFSVFSAIWILILEMVSHAFKLPRASDKFFEPFLFLPTAWFIVTRIKTEPFNPKLRGRMIFLIGLVAAICWWGLDYLPSL